MTEAEKHSSALRALFEQQPCWMIEPLARQLSYSVPSVRRMLAAAGYYSSFTHNGRWYTLDGIPEFDSDGLWYCGNIGFSRQGSLTATLAHLACRSPAGMTADELGMKLHCRCHAVLTRLHRCGTLVRQKVGRSYVYLAADAAVRSRQQRALEERTPAAGPLPAEIAVLVLAEFIRSSGASAEELARSLARDSHVSVSPMQIDRLFEQYGVKKKGENEAAHALRALRESLDRLALETSPGALFSGPPTVRFRPERTVCDCGAALLVQKTRKKDVYSMVGPFVAHETLLYCSRCGKVYSSGELADIVASGCNVAYDVLVFTGRALFQRCLTVNEVLGELSLRNVRISSSEVSYLGRKFIACLTLAHREATPRIREAMAPAGGYVLHLDAMHAGDAPALMTGLDGLSHIVLGNTKLPSESAENIKPFLEELRDRFGTPLACVHDMGGGICAAVDQVFSGVPDFICHFHFLRDVGKDLLEPSYARLRKRLRKHAVSGRLRALVRELAPPLTESQTDCAGLAKAIRGAELSDDPELVPAAAAYALAQWVLKGKHLGNGYGFPFDRPLLDFAERLLELLEQLPVFINVLLRGDWRDNKPLYKISRELSRAADDTELRRALKELRWRCELFDSLRAAMRIAPPNGAKGLNDAGDSGEIKTIRARVLHFREKLWCDPKLSADPLCAKMAEQIDKYAEKLFADPITVSTAHGPVSIQPQRTNNILEQFFRSLRRGHRRRTGNDCMSRSLQTMLADTPLVKNLDNAAYMDMLLGNKQTLEERFAELDAQQAGDNAENDESETSSKLPGFASLERLKKLPRLVAKLFSRSAATTESN